MRIGEAEGLARSDRFVAILVFGRRVLREGGSMSEAASTQPGRKCLLTALIRIPPGGSLEAVKCDGPERASYHELPDGSYRMEHVITEPGEPELAAGDLDDEARENFLDLVNLQRFTGCGFHLEVVVGAPHPDPFVLESRLVIMLATLQCSMAIYTSEEMRLTATRRD